MPFIRRLVLYATLTAALALTLSSSVSADEGVLAGVRAGYYTKVEEPFLGAELLVRLVPSVYFNPNFEYVFTENRKYYTMNADFHYDFPTHGRSFFWAGAGLGLVRIDPENRQETTTDAAANFLLGVGLGRGRVIPYFQAKVIAKDDTEFVLAVGLRF